MTTTDERLTADGWKKFDDRLTRADAAYWRRFDTPTRCAHNEDKDGLQVCAYVYSHDGRESVELDLYGGLQDGSAVKMQAYAHADLDAALASIPRLLAAWERYANYEPKETER